METKANYMLIGLFTLAGILGTLGLLLWLAKVEVDRQYAYYDIRFDDVTGLGSASDVRYNGVPVGQVIDIALDGENADHVRVQIEVSADTPVNADTIARLQSQGVTGVSYVALKGGDEQSAPLPDDGMIPSERTALQSVFDGAPKVLDRAVTLLDNINDVFDDDNKMAVASILENLAVSSGRLDTVLRDFESLSADLGSAARNVAGFAERLDLLADTADETLMRATSALDTAKGTLNTINTFTVDELTPLARDARTTILTANGVITSVGEDTSRIAARLDTLADDGTDTLRSATGAFESATKTLAQIDTTMQDASTTLGTADQTFAMANTIIENDVSAIIADLRGAATAFTSTITNASGSIDTISTEVVAASRSAANFTGALEDVVAGNQRQLSDFLRLGLPEFLRLTEEARGLVTNLERLVNKIERDPARFLLGTQNSEFNR
ncbi:MlaD family protein [uncultured Tateyamaria sp.]|uniref:MlaD family protein n=1 Tax=uncultured Tateyamaria sp. TaxID=455651 RepID=UPI00261BA109|nr:MlaD family protein [uncultured Tateyamaria sp.]